MKKEIETVFKVDRDVYPKLNTLSSIWKTQWENATNYVVESIEDEDNFVKIIKQTYDPFILAAACRYLYHVRDNSIIDYETCERCLKTLITSVNKIEEENRYGYNIFTLLIYKKQQK